MTALLRTKKFVLMAGNIGSGKTSLTRLVGEKLGWQTAYESVADNPYLADFYEDMRQWSFHLQVCFPATVPSSTLSWPSPHGQR